MSRRLHQGITHYDQHREAFELGMWQHNLEAIASCVALELSIGEERRLLSSQHGDSGRGVGDDK